MFAAKRWHLVLFLLLFLTIGTPLFILKVEAAPLVWHIETVDAANNVGEDTSIALDSNDYPHISYYDAFWDDLKYARWTGSAWAIEPVDTVGEVGMATSLALDASDRPHISYYDFENGIYYEYTLKYARWTGSAWAIDTIDVFTSIEVEVYTSLALDASSYAHISYLDVPNGDVKYARWTGSSWSSEVVDNAFSSEISIVLDSLNRPRISYTGSSGFLKYARWTGSEWSLETVDTGCSAIYASLALDASDRPHISYYDDTNDNLKYARWSGSAWIIETVNAAVNVGGYSSLALDANDRPHIGYYDFYWEDLKYAWWNGTGWFIKNVDSVGDVGSYCALALDSDDHPHISYRDQDNGNLKYASDPDEYIYTADTTRFDASGDGFNDSVEVELDVDTTYSGTLNVSVVGVLTNGVGTEFDGFWSWWEITGTAIEHGYVYLGLPEGAPEGWYNVALTLYDERGGIEDEWQLDAVAYLYPPDMRELTIQVEGPGTTDPVPGSWWIASGGEIGVTALPETGYVLAHWVLDGVDAGQANPLMVSMEANHVLLAVFTEEVTPLAVIESCNEDGEPQELYGLEEVVFVRGSGYAPSQSYAVYVVPDVVAWTEGQAIPSRVAGTAPTLTSNAEGVIGITGVWEAPLTEGQFDVVVDVNGNGQYDAGVDALDDSDIEVTAGWIIIPELPVALMLLFFIVGTFVALLLRRRLKGLPRHPTQYFHLLS